jgi:hypothetical protein
MLLAAAWSPAALEKKRPKNDHEHKELPAKRYCPQNGSGVSRPKQAD